jgi:UDP-N-acetylglucosamine diphosphorylase / glucose-1-phosphate thymidylyltransferase / UDP-N-acetylgalactosamine diphosphorylase / glucosamine-1-phosphate N-acetyltransferase / galactosamine-1-phosphate N-acetyltransferase
MSKKLFIFEDDKYDRFFPLTYNRPVYELLCGITRIKEKISQIFPGAEVVLLCRDYLEKVLANKTKLKVNQFEVNKDDEILLINGRVIPSPEFLEKLNFSNWESFFFSGDDLIGWTGRGEVFGKFKTLFQSLYVKDQIQSQKSKLTVTEIDVKPVNYLWDLVSRNGDQIETDFAGMKPSLDFKNMFKHCQVDDDALIYGIEKVYIGPGSQVEGQVVLDARSGSIYIGERVNIQPYTLVKGPCYVGDDSILTGGRIREGTSIGPVCRVGGEVEGAIFLGYSNKYHEGFLGHAYVGEWVNLGALTTNSDLKNNYGTVKVMVNEALVDSGLTKVGSFIGDQVKTGIGTLLNTGISLGFASNVFGGGMLKLKYVPAFFWGGPESREVYELSKALKTIRVVMKRRGVELTGDEENLFKKIYELTEKERG